MARENVEIVRRWADVIQQADQAEWARMIDAIFAADAEWIEDEAWPGATTFTGREPIKARIEDYNEAFGWRLVVEDILGAGADEVVILIRAEGRGEASGIETEGEWAFLLTFAAGEIIRWQVFLDRSAALEAAGL